MRIASVQQPANDVVDYRSAYAFILKSIDEASKGGAELIILPECAYPAYFLEIDEAVRDEALKLVPQLLDEVAAKAKNNKVYVALGVALPENGKLYNAAVLYDDEGKLVHTAKKSNLWHMDCRSFVPGDEFKAFDTKFGRMGMMICADGRIPEIARILAKEGAKLIIDPVNLVSNAQDQKALLNQQYSFILSARAKENRVWIVTSDKCGMEAGSALYLGRSMFVAPDGEILAEAAPDKPEIVYCDVDLEKAAGPENVELPKACSIICEETENLPAYKEMISSQPAVNESEKLIANVQYTFADVDEYLAKGLYYTEAAAKTWGQTLVLPLARDRYDIEEYAPKLIKAMCDEKMTVFTGYKCNGKNKAFAVTSDGVIQEWNDDEIIVCEIEGINYCVLFDDKMYIPEYPRTAMLMGANMIVWLDSENRPDDLKFAKTRAGENKLFISRSASDISANSYLVNHSSNTSSITLTGEEQMVEAVLLKSDTLSKTVLPGTDIIMGRIPHAYKEMIK